MPKTSLGTILISAAVLQSAPAFAQETTDGASPTPDVPLTQPAPAPQPVEVHLGAFDRPSGGSFAMGFETGLFGGDFEQGARFRIGLGDHFALTIKGVAIHRFAPDYRMDMGARIGFLGGSTPVLNMVRAYGGGGVQIIAPITGGADGEGVRFGMGGEVGIEAFLLPSMSAFIEVGGQGSFNEAGYGSGATVMSGFHWYFGGNG